MAVQNPALLSCVADKTLNLNYMLYMDGVNVGGAAFARTAGERSTWAVTAQYVNYGELKETTEENIEIGTFSAKDISISGIYTYDLSDYWSGGVRPKAPGMKYKHYAPKADLTLVEPANVAEARKTGEAVAMTQEQVNAMVETVWKLAKEKIDAGYKVGIICTDESRSHYPEGEVRSIGARKSQASVAHNLYALLREFDDLKVDYIYSESFSQDHLGQAIMNRLSKAAGYQIYKV